ncbi:hypothetical protein Tco_0991569 [Tanacetum coccineum]|uniref:Uncharacterized protein n=1 Tax=Tanacetum coccineum TaxID=301880 RepID=A0ABQ5EZX9_9ASTR
MGQLINHHEKVTNPSVSEEEMFPVISIVLELTLLGISSPRKVVEGRRDFSALFLSRENDTQNLWMHTKSTGAIWLMHIPALATGLPQTAKITCITHDFKEASSPIGSNSEIEPGLYFKLKGFKCFDSFLLEDKRKVFLFKEAHNSHTGDGGRFIRVGSHLNHLTFLKVNSTPSGIIDFVNTWCIESSCSRNASISSIRNQFPQGIYGRLESEKRYKSRSRDIGKEKVLVSPTLKVTDWSSCLKGSFVHRERRSRHVPVPQERSSKEEGNPRIGQRGISDDHKSCRKEERSNIHENQSLAMAGLNRNRSGRASSSIIRVLVKLGDLVLSK